MKPTAHFELRHIAPEAVSTLRRIKRRIRTLVVLEGVALAIIWLVAMFWIGLAIDYLPVKFGQNELSRPARIGLLCVTGSVTAWLIFHFVFRRVCASLKDTSIALLIERKYPEFNESLVTTVERAKRDAAEVATSADASLLTRAAEQANALCKTVITHQVLNQHHVTRLAKFAAGGILSIGIFATASPAALSTAVDRLCFLDQQRWPRQNHIVLAGLKVEYQTPVEGIAEFDENLPNFASAPADSGTGTEGIFYVAKGASVNLLVRALAPDASPDLLAEDIPPDFSGQIPASCVMQFRFAGGRSGSQTLNRIGNPTGGWQTYRLRGTPLGSISESLTFYLQGGDHRIGPFEIRTIDDPLVEHVELDCVFPDYMVDEESGRWTPRSIPVTGPMATPQGTRMEVVARTNRSMTKVYTVEQNAGEKRFAEVTETGFRLPIERISTNLDLAFYMVDRYGVVSETPHRITLDSVEDQPPVVEGELRGIGSAITPNAIIPLEGTVIDDYDVDSVWMEIATPVSDTIVQEVARKNDRGVKTRFDLRQYAQEHSGFTLPEKNAEVSVILKASDKMNLTGTANIGLGDQHTLELVSGGVFLKRMEQLEVGQRKRLEQIYNEVSDVREYLLRTRLATGAADDDTNRVILEPGETLESSRDSGTRNELRILFAQRSLLQIDKSSREIAGVANAFDDIRLQLINNRVDSEDRKIRLAKKIVAPLRSISAGILKELRQLVAELDKALVQGVAENANHLTNRAIRLTDQSLVQIDAILSILVKYETQNELLDIVRRMIEEQETLRDEVKKLRQREAFDNLFE